MSYSKISTITLYVVAVISLVVILFFYVSPRTVDIDELEARVEQLTTEGVVEDQPEEAPAKADSTAVDSLGMTAETDSTEVAETDSAVVAAAVEEVPPTVEIDLRDHLSGWELMVYKRTDYALKWAYILLALAAIAAVLFPLVNIVTDVKAIIRLLAVLTGAVVLILLSYFAFASDASIDILGYTGTDNTDPVALRWIGTGLFTTYIIFGVAIVSILYFEIANLFK
ncbi:MAG: hypothetical protein K9J30_07375 [Bacteroidales bacterium]|nr:hypothetical protein [Bacteroidales bacterium]